MATAYTIRDFPKDLHKRAKSTAALEGISLRELILKSLRVYVEGVTSKAIRSALSLKVEPIQPLTH